MRILFLGISLSDRFHIITAIGLSKILRYIFEGASHLFLLFEIIDQFWQLQLWVDWLEVNELKDCASSLLTRVILRKSKIVRYILVDRLGNGN